MIARQTRERRFYIWLWVSLIFVCSVSYKPEVMANPAVSDPLQEGLGKSSKSLHVHIYFDATLSMQGFVNPGSTDYTRLIPHLESVVLSGWADGKVEFYRFGTHVEPVDRDSYLSVHDPQFYEDGEINRETLIEKVIDHEYQEGSDEETRLSVIITDLFQTKSDANLLVAEFKDKCLKDNLAVGMMGIRSHFEGMVYDIGVGIPPKPYKSDPDDPSTWRPFYLLVVGRHLHISQYFDSLISAGNIDARTVIYSPHLTQPLEDWTVNKLDNLVRVRDIIPDRNDRVDQFRVQGNPDNATFLATLTCRPLPHAMSFDPSQIETLIVARNYPEGEESAGAATCLDISAVVEMPELNISATLTPNALPHKGKYRFEVSLSPKLSGIGSPSWSSTGPEGWDMGMKFDGSRTRNLSHLISNLSQVTARIHQPVIAKFTFYVEKR